MWSVARDLRENLNGEISVLPQTARNAFKDTIAAMPVSCSYDDVVRAACRAVVSCGVSDDRVYDSTHAGRQYMSITHDWRLAFTKADEEHVIVIHMFRSDHRADQANYNVNSNPRGYKVHG